MLSSVRCHFVVSGVVQGVGFRFYVRRRARQLGLTGWVRNRADSTVEAEAQGETEAVATLERIMRAGPPGSRVDELAIAEAPLIEGEHEFVVLATR